MSKNSVNTSKSWQKIKDLMKKGSFKKQPEVKLTNATKQQLEKMNTALYRTKYKINTLHKDAKLKSGGLLKKNEYMFLDRSQFSEIKVISDPSKSASDSVVVILKKGKQQFILKLTFVKKYEMTPFNFPDSEAKMYEIMNILVRKNITPHVFMLVDSFGETFNRKDIPRHFNTFLNKYNTYKQGVYPILTETCNDDAKLVTLYELINKLNKYDPISTMILENIMFQIMYTLHCFNLCGIKHNDLHTGNIFVLKRPENILNKNHKFFYRNYEYLGSNGDKNVVSIPNIGLDVRIFDFDRSVKQKNKFRYHPEGLKSRYLRKYYQFNQNAKDNQDTDTYKVLCHLYSRGMPSQIKSRIESYFYDQNLIKNGYYTHNGKKKYVDKRYFLIPDPFPNLIMKKTIEILDDLATSLNKMNGSMSVREHYSALNIDSSEKERLKSILEARELAYLKRTVKAKVEAVNKPKVAATTKTKATASSAKKYPIKRKSNQKKSVKNNNSKVECNDRTTKRSSQKTSVMVNGKKRYGKLIDTEEKNCMFPFKYGISQGKGKRKLIKESKKQCIKDQFGTWCSTERNPNCMMKKIGYCV